MQKTSIQAHGSVATGTSSKHVEVASIQAPFAPLNLLRAGVPPREVVWFRRLKPDRQFAALRTTRGQLLLEQLRSHLTHATGGMALTGQAA